MANVNKKILKQGKKLLKDLNNWKNSMANLSQGDLSTSLTIEASPINIPDSQARTQENILNQIITNLHEVAAEFNLVTDKPCKRLCYVGGDSFLEGQRCGELMGEILNGKGQVAVVTNVFGYASTELRRKGLESVFNTLFPGIHIVDIIESRDSEQISYEKTTSLIKKYSNLNGIYICEGATPKAVAQAVIDAKKTDKIRIIAHDLTNSIVEFIEKGVITAVLDENPYAQGFNPIIHLYNHLVDDWEPQVPRLLTDMKFVTQENYHEFWNAEKKLIQSQDSLDKLVKPIDKKPPKPIRIAMMGRVDCEFWLPVKEGSLAAKKLLENRENVQVDLIIPEENRTKGLFGPDVFVPAFKKLIHEHYDGIGVIASDAELVPHINHAVERGIPVVTMNSEPFNLRSLMLSITDQADKLMGLSDHLSVSTTETKAMTSNINTAMDEMYQGTLSQNENVKKTQDTLSHLLKNIKTVNEETEENAKTAEQTVKAVTSGTTAMEKTIESLRMVENSVSDSWQVVEELGDYSNKIDKIMWFINDIATEINILGLNANLVSVKAGKYGKSFGVVASEIRKMVQETKNHTTEIFNLIEMFKEGIKKVEDVMNSGLEKIKSSANLSDEAVSAIKDIREYVNLNQQRMNKISSSLNEIETFSQDVDIAMHNVTSVSEQNAAEVQKVNNYTKEMENQLNTVESMTKTLLEMAESEKQQLAKFNVADKA